MAQVSRRKLSARVWEKLWQTFVMSFEQSGKKGEVGVLFSGLLTPTERKMLTKRMVALVLLAGGWKVYQVAEQLRMSVSTVYKYKQQLLLQPKLKDHLRVYAISPQLETSKKFTEPMALRLIEAILEGYRDRSKLQRFNQPS